MPSHIARFPGVSNDPNKHLLTTRQAARLSELTNVPAKELLGKSTADLAKRLQLVVDPKFLAFRRICGQVVKTDAGGNDLPVPFATVNVYDVDLRLLAWSPPWLPYSWFFPFAWQREKLATVTTDECGRFCVWIPRFDIDYYLRWRLERRCYLEWLRKPTLDDLLRYREIIPPIPEPDPGPIRQPIGPRPIELHKVMTHAAKMFDTARVAKVREAVSEDLRPGALSREAEAKLGQFAFAEQVPPPNVADVQKLLSPAMRPKLAARVGVQPQMLERLDPAHFHGPFLRCKYVVVPEWTAVLDVPDLTFEVTQDIDGDGQQEIIYREGLFDVRWNTNTITDIKIHAQSNAIAGPSCNLQDPGPCGDPAILFAGNYPLQATSAVSDYHDASSGYAKLPNRPDQDGVPGGTRTTPAATPVLGQFYLMGCAEKSGATHYRVRHDVAGSSGYLSGSYGPLLKVVGGVLQQLLVSPVNGQWYPIIPRADGWTPVGILAPVNVAGTAKHTFQLELGNQSGATISPLANPPSAVSIMVDNTVPVVTITDLAWRQPDSSLSWTTLDPFNCAVMARANAGRVQIRLGFAVTANHLRHFQVTPAGCGPIAAPSLITEARDGLPAAAADAAAHWHMNAGDNSASRVLYYELAAGAPAGCYSFSILASSRAFDSGAAVTGPDPVVAWTNYDPMPVWTQPVVNVALQ